MAKVIKTEPTPEESLPTRGTNKKIEKKSFSLSDFKAKKGLDENVKDKDIKFYELGEAFKEATGLPGFPRGYVCASRGFSDTGKSTSVFMAAVSAQKMGDLPVIMDLENNIDWEHMRKMGLEFEEIFDEQTGEVVNYEGHFIYINSLYLLDHYSKKKDKERREPSIEDSSRFIDDLLESQEKGELPFNLCIIYDSVGCVNSVQVIKSLEEETNNNNMWNASSIEVNFKGLWNHQIPMSRKENKKYINTFIATQRVWEKSVGGKPILENKGGKALYSSARLFLSFGGVMSHGISKLYATKNGKKIHLGNITKVAVLKNQIGSGYGGVSMEGELISTPHGFIANTKEAIDKYKKEHLDYFNTQLESNGDDFDIIEVKEKIKEPDSEIE